MKLSLPGKKAASEAVSQALAAPEAAAPAAQPEAQPEPPKRRDTPAPRRDEDDEPLERPKHARDEALAEIAARRKADIESDSQETLPETDEDGNELTLERAAEQADAAADAEEIEGDETQAKPASVSAAKPAFDPEAEYDVIVDGKPQKVKGSQIIDAGTRTLQKESAADERLRKATELLTQAEARSKLPVEGAEKQPKPEDGMTAEQLAEAIQYGSKEQATVAIKELMTRAAKPAVTAEDVQRIVREQVPTLSRDEIAFQEARAFVDTEYGDLFKNPYLKQVFEAEDSKRRASGSQKPYIEHYREIGEELRKAFAMPKAPSPTSPAATRQEKLDAKAKAPRVPQPAASRLDGGEKSEKQPTRAELIDAMRKGRNQQPLH